MRVPLTCQSEDSQRSNQSVLKEVKPEYLLEGLMLKSKLQYFGHLTSVHGVTKNRKRLKQLSTQVPDSKSVLFGKDPDAGKN